MAKLNYENIINSILIAILSQNFLLHSCKAAGNSKEPVHIFETPNSPKYSGWYPLFDGVFTFRVKTNRDAHVALSPYSYESELTHQICFGGWVNKKCCIYETSRKLNAVVVPCPDQLSDKEFRGFWIRWSGSNITVGNEGETKPFMSYDSPDKFPIKFAGIRTFPSTGVWAIEPVHIFETPNSPKYSGWYPLFDGVFTFRVKTNRDAHVALSPYSYESELTHQICFGGWVNKKCCIYETSRKLNAVVVPCPDQLSDKEFRGFWIRWSGSNITVGNEGETKPFMSYDSPDKFPIKFAGIRTFPSTGVWEIKI